MAGLLELRDLTVELPTPTGWLRPVNGVSLALEESETLGIVGESGSGKTMLSLALMGLTPPGARRSGKAWLAALSNNHNDAGNSVRNSTRGPGNRAAPATAAPRRNLLTASSADRHDLSGADDRAEPGDAHRRANRRGDPRAPAGRYVSSHRAPCAR
jgi:ABC-type dipeptide/oligopeptide/nickel transport system ATPase component